jgi:hypothetical protein
VQCGFSYPLQKAPELVSSNRLAVTGAASQTQTVRVVGSLPHPEDFFYEPSSNFVARYHVRFDHDSESLIIDRLNHEGTRTVLSIGYQIIAVKPWDIQPAAQPFSWETYRSNAGRIVANVIQDGATVSAKVTADGTLQLGGTTEPAQPLPARKGADSAN